ncbi:MAG: ferritin-like domain-containing protein [Gemmatimonadaceae bacterium]|nr:ferritin-like domain-containing protein [Gemmatimonadaceae bacterium]
MGMPVSGETNLHKSWSLASEIDWGTIDAAFSKADADLMMLVRRAALRAARRTVGLSHLLAALASDSVASALLARELHDSWKHFHALRSYLEVVEYSPAIADAELDQHRRAAPQDAVRRGDDAAARLAHLLDDAARDGAVFGLIRARAGDPVLARLADRIASDRQQHSLALARYLADCTPVECDMTA